MSHSFKISVVGASCVGKSTLMNKFINNSTCVHSPTIGVEYFCHRHTYTGEYTSLNGYDIKFSIWDLAGGERFKPITRSYIPSTQGLILVFDLTHSQSLIDLENWISEIKHHLSLQHKETCLPGIVIGNKKDINQREVTKEEGQAFASKYGYSYAEVSATTDQLYIKPALDEFFDKMVETYADQIPRQRPNNIYPKSHSNHPKRSKECSIQ